MNERHFLTKTGGGLDLTGIQIIPVPEQNYCGRQWGYVISLPNGTKFTATTGGTGPCWNIGEDSATVSPPEDAGNIHVCDLDDLIAALTALRGSNAHAHKHGAVDVSERAPLSGRGIARPSFADILHDELLNCVNGCGNPATATGECVRCRDKWTCTAIIPDRLHPGQTRKCCVAGSEVSVHDGATYCPRHIPA